MKDLIFAAIFKSTSRIFFHLENPEISAVLDPKLVGGRGSVLCSAAVENTKKNIFFFFERVFHMETNDLRTFAGEFSTLLTY